MTLIFMYLISVFAVITWDEITKDPSNLNLLSEKEKFMPIYNTLVAMELWIRFNPFSNKN